MGENVNNLRKKLQMNPTFNNETISSKNKQVFLNKKKSSKALDEEKNALSEYDRIRNEILQKRINKRKNISPYKQKLVPRNYYARGSMGSRMKEKRLKSKGTSYTDPCPYLDDHHHFAYAEFCRQSKFSRSVGDSPVPSDNEALTADCSLGSETTEAQSNVDSIIVLPRTKGNMDEIISRINATDRSNIIICCDKSSLKMLENKFAVNSDKSSTQSPVSTSKTVNESTGKNIASTSSGTKRKPKVEHRHQHKQQDVEIPSSRNGDVPVLKGDQKTLKYILKLANETYYVTLKHEIEKLRKHNQFLENHIDTMSQTLISINTERKLADSKFQEIAAQNLKLQLEIEDKDKFNRTTLNILANELYDIKDKYNSLSQGFYVFNRENIESLLMNTIETSSSHSEKGRKPQRPVSKMKTCPEQDKSGSAPPSIRSRRRRASGASLPSVKYDRGDDGWSIINSSSIEKAKYYRPSKTIDLSKSVSSSSVDECSDLLSDIEIRSSRNESRRSSSISSRKVVKNGKVECRTIGVTCSLHDIGMSVD